MFNVQEPGQHLQGSPSAASCSSPYTAADSSTAYRENFRILGGEAEDGRVRLPLHGLFAACRAVLPIAEALRPVAASIPNFDATLDVVRRRAGHLWAQLGDSDPAVAQRFDANLLCYLLFYTAEAHPKTMSVYYVMGAALRAEDRTAAKPWVHYIWGLLNALKRLPPSDDGVLFRGFRGDWGPLSNTYRKGEEVTWHAFASCSADLDVQQRFVGTSGDRVLFYLEMKSGFARDIRRFSWYPAETEVLLPPGVSFKVKGVLDHGNGLRGVHLTEQGLRHPILEF
eukprot:EG_transcript_12036